MSGQSSRSYTNTVGPVRSVTTFGPPNSAAVSETVTEVSVVVDGATPANVKFAVAWVEPAGIAPAPHITVAVLVPAAPLGKVHVYAITTDPPAGTIGVCEPLITQVAPGIESVTPLSVTATGFGLVTVIAPVTV